MRSNSITAAAKARHRREEVISEMCEAELDQIAGGTNTSGFDLSPERDPSSGGGLDPSHNDVTQTIADTIGTIGGP